MCFVCSGKEDYSDQTNRLDLEGTTVTEVSCWDFDEYEIPFL